MTNSRPLTNSDDLLRTFLHEEDERAAQCHLQHLIEIVTPVISGAVRRKVNVESPVFIGSKKGQRQEEQDRDDLQGDALTQLIVALQNAREARDGKAIEDVRAYAAMVAYNVVGMHWRRCAPLRHSLANRVRYVLEHQARLSSWENGTGVRVGGFEAWHTSGNPAHTMSPRLRRLQDAPSLFTQSIASTLSSTQVTEQGLAAMLDWVGHPVPVSALVGIWAEILGVRDERTEDLSAVVENRLPDPSRGGARADLGERLTLEGWWAELRQLSPNQCAALLLQARDAEGNSLLELLRLEGLASLRELAVAMGMDPLDLARLWNDLPLDDARIARQLGIHPQSVARLRMNARERMRQKAACS